MFNLSTITLMLQALRGRGGEGEREREKEKEVDCRLTGMISRDRTLPGRFIIESGAVRSLLTMITL